MQFVPEPLTGRLARGTESLVHWRMLTGGVWMQPILILLSLLQPQLLIPVRMKMKTTMTIHRANTPASAAKNGGGSRNSNASNGKLGAVVLLWGFNSSVRVDCRTGAHQTDTQVAR